MRSVYVLVLVPTRTDEVRIVQTEQCKEIKRHIVYKHTPHWRARIAREFAIGADTLERLQRESFAEKQRG